MLLREMVSSLSAEGARLGARVRGAGDAVRAASAKLAPCDMARSVLLLDVKAPLQTLQAEVMRLRCLTAHTYVCVDCCSYRVCEVLNRI